MADIKNLELIKFQGEHSTWNDMSVSERVKRSTLAGACAVACQSMFQQTKYYDRPYNPNYVREHVEAFMAGDNKVCHVVQNKITGQVVGFIVGSLSRFFFNDDAVLFEEGFFVEAEYRKAGIGGLLLKSFERVAIENNAEVHVTVSAGIEDGRVLAMLKSRDYKRQSVTMTRDFRTD